MPKQPQTISFELAEKLSKYNLNFEPYFWWIKHYSFDDTTSQFIFSGNPAEECLEDDEFYPAYQLHEILEMLPDEIKGYDLTLSKRKNEFLLDYFTYYDRYVYLCELTSEKEFSFQNKNPAEAAGNLLLWCIENGYIKP